MKTKVFTLAIALNVFAAAPIWAQQKSPDANLLAQLEKRLAESDTKSKGLTGGQSRYGSCGRPKSRKLSSG